MNSFSLTEARRGVLKTRVAAVAAEVLPLAHDKGMGVLINSPRGGRRGEYWDTNA
jgi:hypothetical protein